MNKIGEEQCEDILSSFGWDSTGHEETNITRKKERADSHIFFFRDWFNIMTARGLGEARGFKQYKNSFSEKRNKFSEDGDVSLRCFDRQGFYALHSEREKAQFFAKFFARERYTREKRERCLANYFIVEKYSEEQMKEFLVKYFFIEKYSKEEGKQFLAKYYDREQSAKERLY